MALNLRSTKTGLGRGVGQGTIYRDRLDEELFFRNSGPPELPIDVIRHVWLSFVGVNDIAVLFENGRCRFALIIVVEDATQMGWKECQCLNDAIRTAERGHVMTNDIFKERFSSHFRQTYGKAEGPRVEHNILLGYVYPVQGTLQNQFADTLKSTGISVDNEGDIILLSETFGGMKYTVCVELSTKWADHKLPSKKQALYKLDCKVLMRLLTILETGDKLDRISFLGCMAELRNEFNFVVVDRYDKGKYIAANILASRVKNTEPMPPPLAEALHYKCNQGSGQPTLQDQDQPSLGRQISLSDELDPDEPSGLPVCPYPGCSYTARLKESGQASLFAGKYNGGGHKNKDVAIKVFEEEDNMEVYRRELSLLLKMASHPNVVDVLDFFEHPVPCVVMELISGSDMMDYLEKNGAMEVKDARRTALALADGILHLHRNGAVHRDLKSSNVLIDDNGAPIIIDLGLGATINRVTKPRPGGRDASDGNLRRSLTETFADMTVQAGDGILGTILWLAPEMIKHQQWGKFTDTWAFGVILWEMLTGILPYVKDGVADDSNSPVAIFGRIAGGETPDMALVKHADEDLRDLMTACWASSPRDRPSMKRVVDVLSGKDPVVMFNRADRNHDNALDFYEFVSFMEVYAKDKIHVSLIYDVFDAIDTDNDGDVNLAEFQKFWGQVDMFGLDKALSMCQKSSFDLESSVQAMSKTFNGARRTKRVRFDTPTERRQSCLVSCDASRLWKPG